MIRAGNQGAWLAQWLDAVASGQSTMSQRGLSNIEKHGGMALLRREARKRGLHILQLTDDQGRELVAASRTKFKVIC